MNPSQTQALSALRTVLQIAGTVLAARYALDPTVVDSVVSQTMAFAGAAVVLGSTIWGLFEHRDAGILAKAQKIEAKANEQAGQ